MTVTKGLNHKIWAIAWPAILSNISLPLLGLVDTAILGHLDSHYYLGAVAIGASLLSFLYWGFGFLRMGTTGLVARAFGAGDQHRQLQVLLQSGVLALLLAFTVVALHPLWLGLGMQLMAPGPEITPLALSYASIRIYSAPAVLITYAIVGWFIGRQNTRWPMVFVVLTNSLNIVLDVLFIIVLDMKSDGAALATLLAEYAGCAMAIAAVLRQADVRASTHAWRGLARWHDYAELLQSNKYLFIRTMCLLFSFAFFTAMSTRMGEDVLAANAIALNLLIFAAYAMDGFAFAVEALCGSALGARRQQEFYQVVRACWHWSLATAGALSLIFLAADPYLFRLFTKHTVILDLLSDNHPWLLVMPLIAVGSYLLDGVFIGTAKTRYMMTTMLFSLFVVYLPLWYLLRGLGNNGLWLAFVAFNGARGISLWWCFTQLRRSNGWFSG